MYCKRYPEHAGHLPSLLSLPTSAWLLSKYISFPHQQQATHFTMPSDDGEKRNSNARSKSPPQHFWWRLVKPLVFFYKDKSRKPA